MTFKDAVKAFFAHFRIFSSIGNEAAFSFKKILPLFIVLVLPLVYPLFISLTYVQKTVVMRTAVVLDLDNSAYTRDLVTSLDATQGLNIVRSVNSLDEGIQSVMSREADTFIFFPEDFSAKMKRFERGDMKVYVYATNMMIYASVMTAIQTSVLEKDVDIAVERIANPKGIVGEKAYNVMDPLKYDRSYLYSPTLSYGEYITPILLTLVFHQLGILILALAIGYHREIDPVFAKRKLWLIDYLWRFLFYLPLICVGILAVYYIYVPLFGWPHGCTKDIIIFIMLMICANFPISAALASLCRDRYTCFQFLLASTLVLFSYSGYVWPTYAMPDWVLNISNYLNEQQMGTAVRKIVFRGSHLDECIPQIRRMFELFLIYLPFSLLIIHRDLLAWPFKKVYQRIRGSKKSDTDALPSPESQPSA